MTSYLRSTDDGVILSVKVQPRAARNEIAEPLGNELKVKVTAPPVDSAANEALVKFLAEVLEIPRGRVSILRGHTSRHKQIFLQGLALLEAEAKIAT